MNSTDRKMWKKIEDLDSNSVQDLLRRNGLEEFQEFARGKELDGRKLMNVTEGIVKMWKPKINANKLISFIQDLKKDPHKYLLKLKQEVDKEPDGKIPKVSSIEETISKMIDEETETITITQELFNSESQYQTVKKTRALKVEENKEQYQTVKKTKEDNSFSNIDELLKRIVPVKSFLYRNQMKNSEVTSYLPMDAVPAKKRKLFRMSNYDYPFFDLKRYSKPEGDRGYYPMKRNSRFFIQKTKTHESRPKYNSISTTEELKYPEDHFYEDLCYTNNENDNERSSVSSAQSKPYRLKIQELFQSFKMPFLKKPEEVVGEVKNEDVEERKIEVVEKKAEKEPMYENGDNEANMYDSVHVRYQDEHVKEDSKTKLPVEDYLEPVQLSKDYCDVTYKQKDDSLLGYIMSIFETRFGIRRETHDDQTEESEPEPSDTKWVEIQHHMADRPLPVPVENEPYYMDIDRLEAENLLKGQPDGTFVLRPSSQVNHAYTLSVSCAGAVHNVGVRRRADGRLSLGFARKGERSFPDVPSLLRHHKRRRLLLVARTGVLGATTLNESAHYYQTPRSLH